MTVAKKYRHERYLIENYAIYCKKFCILTKHSYLCNPKLKKGSQIEIWCNGSTTDSGSVSEGSSPSITTTIFTTVMAV